MHFVLYLVAVLQVSGVSWNRLGPVSIEVLISGYQSMIMLIGSVLVYSHVIVLCPI
jgi:hypothetical protein